MINILDSVYEFLVAHYPNYSLSRDTSGGATISITGWPFIHSNLVCVTFCNNCANVYTAEWSRHNTIICEYSDPDFLMNVCMAIDKIIRFP